MVLGLFYIDLFFHGLLTFGWSSIDQIMKHEGFFNDSNNVTSNSVQAQTSGQIFVSSIVKVQLEIKEIIFIVSKTTLLSASRGLLILALAFLRDFVSLGLARLAAFSILILAYLL